MTRQRNSTQRLTHKVSLGLIASVLSGLVLVGWHTSAEAQLRPWDNNNQVMIDLSVLGDNGVGAPPIGGNIALPSLTGDLLNPPTRMPRSQLLSQQPPVGGRSGTASLGNLPAVKLIRPGSRPVSRAKKRVVRKRTKPVSRAPKVAALKAPPPKPMVAAPSKPATNLAPAPKAAPKPPVVVAKAKPAPKPTPKAVAKMTPPAPPKVTAPPPPPKVATPSKPAPKPKETQTASRPPAASAKANDQLTFKQGSAQLSPASQKILEILAGTLSSATQSRMQLLAYAGEPNLSASKARRLSLSRALAVRSYLIKQGVRSTRIDVRALGNKVPSGPPNRVDLKIVGN